MIRKLTIDYILCYRVLFSMNNKYKSIDITENRQKQNLTLLIYSSEAIIVTVISCS